MVCMLGEVVLRVQKMTDGFFGLWVFLVIRLEFAYADNTGKRNRKKAGHLRPDPPPDFEDRVRRPFLGL